MATEWILFTVVMSLQGGVLGGLAVALLWRWFDRRRARRAADAVSTMTFDLLSSGWTDPQEIARTLRLETRDP